MIDADLRAKLTEALLSTREWLTSAEGGWAADLTDALMPIVREALAAAWDEGAEEAYEWQIGVTGKPDNPWREGQ